MFSKIKMAVVALPLSMFALQAVAEEPPAWDGATKHALYTAILQFWQSAAVLGDPESQYNLGVMYERGPAGVMHENGVSVPQDRVQALMWFTLASDGGYEDATVKRDQLANVMTPEQITAAAKLTREWKTHHPSRLHGGQLNNKEGR